MTEADERLLEQATEAAERAYAPYSGFHVGAAVRAADGRVIAGVNVENAAYPLGMCAERTAIARAVAEGYRPGELEVLAVTASPCGGCRQWLVEFGIGRIVYRTARGDVRVTSPADLLPDTFEL